MSSTALVWTLTYLLHSTLLLGAAWVLTRRVGVKSVSAREWLWRGALLAGITSASVQTFVGVRPWAGSTEIPAVIVAAYEQPFASRSATASVPRSAAPSPRTAGSPNRLPIPSAASERAERAERAERPASSLTTPVAQLGTGALARSSRATSRWLFGLDPERLNAALPALGLLGVGLWLVIVALRTQRALGPRRRVRTGSWFDTLGMLTRRAGVRRRVRLTVSKRLTAPVAFGVLRPEICVPARALADPTLARPALAHELAHVVRFDPLWLGLAHVARSLLFLQPLNRVAARELSHLAELSADEWAGRQTGDRLALARCLTEVAGWLRPRDSGLEACAMVRRGGRLEERVRRLLDDAPEPRRLGRLAVGIAISALFVAPLALPGWSATAADGVAQQRRSAGMTRREPSMRTRSWSSAVELARGLEADLDSLMTRVERIPSEHGSPHSKLIERGHQILTQLAHLRAAAERGAARAASHDEFADPGDPTAYSGDSR